MATRMSLWMILICGLVYPMSVTGISQLFFPSQSNGSMIKNEAGTVVGSEMIGQSFQSPKYFHGRVSSINYDGAASGGANLAPSNPKLKERIDTSLKELGASAPKDLITNSASGLDPHITKEAALFQIERVHEQANIPISILTKWIDESTQGRDLGIFGEERVNVLKLNILVDAYRP